MGDVGAGPPPVVPSAADCPLDLGRQLQQQPIIGLLRLRLDAQRAPFSCMPSGREIAGMPQRLANGVWAKLRHRLPNQSSTEGLSLSVRYSVVPIGEVGRAVIGVRMMSQSSKNWPKPRAVVLNTACICARSV